MGLPTWCSGTVLAFFTALVITGGAKRISKVAEIVAPAMALGYILMALIVIFANYERIPEAFYMIFSSAFGLGPAAGGALGTTISMGVKRGLFSNEAGQGGGAIVSAGAINEIPAQQGLVQAFSVYIDTLLICTATALMILCSGVYDDTSIGSNFVAYTQRAIDTIFRDFGSGFIAFSLWLFVFTSLMAYYYYAESSLIYLFDKKKKIDRKTGKKIVWVYRVLFVAIIFLGSQTSSKTAWTLGDIGVGLTAWINVIALFFLFPQALNALKDCEKLYPSKRKCSKENRS